MLGTDAMDVLGRYRNLIVLVGVLFAQILGLAVQVNVKRTTDSEPTRLIRVWAVGAVTPLEKGLVWVQTSSGNLWHNYIYLRGVRAENRELKQQIQRMSLEQARISQDADQARRLQGLLGFKEQFISQTMAAQVIGGSGSESSLTVFIDKGYTDGIRADMAVLTADGIVGKVLHADPANHHVAEVLLINDQSSGVGVILDKTRLQGILRGTPAGEVVLEKVMSDETVPVGEQVLTSGGDGIFPKGLLVGNVMKASPGSDLFLNIAVRPAADLSKLEEVLVVTKIDEKQAQPSPTGAARAVDILAERLPGVPSKPPSIDKTSTDKITAATGPEAATVEPKPVPQPTAANKSATTRVSGNSAAIKAPAPGTAPVDAKPKAAGSSISTAGTTAPRKTATSPPASGSALGAASNDAPKTSPRPVRSTSDPKPQPAVQEPPH